MTTVAPPPIKAEDQAAIIELVRRITTSWKAQDASILGTVYTEDVSMLLPGAHLKGRDVAEEYMTEAFATKWKDTEVLGVPLEMRYLHDDVILLISHGGAYAPGSKEVSVDNAIRGIWVFIKQDGKWIITAYANTPVRATIPIPGA